MLSDYVTITYQVQDLLFALVQDVLAGILTDPWSECWNGAFPLFIFTFRWKSIDFENRDKKRMTEWMTDNRVNEWEREFFSVLLILKFHYSPPNKGLYFRKTLGISWKFAKTLIWTPWEQKFYLEPPQLKDKNFYFLFKKFQKNFRNFKFDAISSLHTFSQLVWT